MELTIPVTIESEYTHQARNFFRWYRGGLRAGHPLLRRILRATMQRHQRITLRSGLKMQVDLDRVVQRTIFWYDGDMEPQLSWAVREFLPVGGTLIDCGANCGFIGLEARLLKRARVLFVEPHPELAATIAANIELNGWGQFCRLVQAAASDQPGSITLFLSSYDGSHSVLADWTTHEQENREVEVSAVTLKQLMQQEPGFDHADFLKIDTEGHDFNVLKGLGDMLHPEKIRVLYTELGRERPAACQWMSEHGYAGFSYQRPPTSLKLRRAVRRYNDGEAVALFYPLDQCPDGFEVLWVAKGGEQEAFLRELAQRSQRTV